MIEAEVTHLEKTSKGVFVTARYPMSFHGDGVIQVLARIFSVFPVIDGRPEIRGFVESGKDIHVGDSIVLEVSED